MTFALAVMTRNGREKLPKLFASLPPFISKVFILDTGSTDGTWDWLHQMQRDNEWGLQISFYQRLFDDFSTSRNGLMSLVKGSADWILVADDDWTIELTVPIDEFVAAFEKAGSDAYAIKLSTSAGIEYRQTLLLRGNRDWQYKGSVHERIVLDGVKVGRGEGLVIYNHSEVTPEKLERYGKLLFQDFAENPDDPHLVFRIGMNFVGMKKFDTAVRFFMMRTTMGGSEEELYISIFNMAHLGLNPDMMTQAANFRPSRAEAPAWLRDFYKLQGEHRLSAEWERTRSLIPMSTDSLYVMPEHYGAVIRPALTKQLSMVSSSNGPSRK